MAATLIGHVVLVAKQISNQTTDNIQQVLGLHLLISSVEH